MRNYICYIGNNKKLADWKESLTEYFLQTPSYIKHICLSSNAEAYVFDEEDYCCENLIIDGYIKLPNQTLFSKTKTISPDTIIPNLLDKNRITTIFGNYGLIFANKNKLFITNDYYGSKPIYIYFVNNNEIAITNELKLFFYLNKNILLDEESIKEYLNPYRMIEQNVLSKNKTLFKDIYKIKQATTTIIDLQTLKITNKNYLNLKKLAKIPYYNIQKEDPVNIFEKTLTNCLKDKLQYLSSSYICSLSGGIDSAILSAALSRIKNEDPQLCKNIFNVNFSIKTSNTMCDDSEIANQISKKLKQNFVKIINTKELGFNNINMQDNITSLEGINYYNNNGYHHSLQMFAQNNKIFYNMNGDGGDYFFSGIAFSCDYFIRKFRFKEAINNCREYLNKTNQNKTIFNYLKFLIGPFIPFYKDHLYYKMLWEESSKFDTKLYYNISKEKKYLKKVKKQLRKSRPFKDFSKRYIIDFIFPRGEYFDSGFENITIVRPLMDIEILLVALKTPNILHNQNYLKNKEFENEKSILKRSFKEELNNSLKQIRNKSNYGSLVAEMLRNDRTEISNILSSSFLLDRYGMINTQTLKNKLKMFTEQASDPQFYPNINTTIFVKTLNMEIFLKIFNNKELFYKKIKQQNFNANKNTLEIFHYEP